MKKLIGALALAAMVATSAFAEVSFGAWICNLPTLVASNGDGDMVSGVTNPWGSWRPVRFSASWASDDGKAGMDMGVCIENGSISTFTPNTFWIKPIDQVKVIVGHMDNSFGVRSDLCFGSWNWLRPNNAVAWGEGITFGAYDRSGIGFLVTPTDALKIFATIPLSSTATDTWKAFGKAAAGATYTIDGLGTIKAGFSANYDGGKTAGYWKNGKTNDDGTDKKYDSYAAAIVGQETAVNPTAIQYVDPVYGGKSELGTIQAAFDLTGIDKLFVTFGVAFKLHENSDSQALTVAAGASYGITEAFKLSADVAMAKSFASGTDPVLSFGVGADYALSDALGFVADVRMKMPNNKADPQLSFLAGLQYACGSNASLGIGFQGGVGLGKKAEAANLQVVSAAAGDKFAWAVPIRASFWF